MVVWLRYTLRWWCLCWHCHCYSEFHESHICMTCHPIHSGAKKPCTIVCKLWWMKANSKIHTIFTSERSDYKFINYKWCSTFVICLTEHHIVCLAQALARRVKKMCVYISQFIVDALPFAHGLLCSDWMALWCFVHQFLHHVPSRIQCLYLGDCKHHCYLNDNDCATMLKMTLARNQVSFFKIFYYGYYLVNDTMANACSTVRISYRIEWVKKG